jgi:hypothetical protein
MTTTLRALTLWQPWAHAVAHLGKDVENRTWKPWPSVIGTRIAIHAAAKVDHLYEAAAERHIARVAYHQLLNADLARGPLPRGVIVATARVTGFVHESESPRSPWFGGPYGWTLDEVIALPAPVPCRGAQGLWRVPDDVAALVLGRLP